MHKKTKRLAGTGLLTAVVIVLQLLAIIIRPTGIFNITLCLVPIVVGAAIYGIGAGAWLGFVFGAVVLATDSSLFLAINPIGTVVTVLLKGLFAGLASAVAYKLLSRINIWVGTIGAAIICPVANTGTFIIGCHLFFMDAINGWAAEAGYTDGGLYIIVGIVGINFLIELAVNALLSSAIVRIISAGKNMH